MYKLYAPPVGVACHVEAIWLLSAPARVRQKAPPALVNAGVAEVAIQLQERLRVFDESDFRPIPRRCVSGFMTRPAQISISSGTRAVGIRFKPGGLAPYSRVPSIEYCNRILELDELLNGSLADDLSCIDGNASNQEIIRQVRKALTRGLAHPAPASIQALEAFASAHRRGVLRSVSSFCHQTGVTIWTLDRWFRSLVGVSPGRFARVLRIRSVLRRISRYPSSRLIDLASDCGYSDQAHLSREFKEFIGVPPGNFLKRCRDTVNPTKSSNQTHALISVVAGTSTVLR